MTSNTFLVLLYLNNTEKLILVTMLRLPGEWTEVTKVTKIKT